MRLIIVNDGFDYHDGLFTGYDPAKRDYDMSTWDYALGAGRLCGRRRDASESALRLEPVEEARLASTRRRWSSAFAARPRTSS